MSSLVIVFFFLSVGLPQIKEKKIQLREDMGEKKKREEKRKV